ncbi:MAG: alternative ribosome rescue aminoacyl-tRNA hydrolase ArfB [Vicinamibacteria bacterium]
MAVAPGVIVPASAFELRAVRSSGPGGQNVNKVASKVELRVGLERVAGLDPSARARLLALAAGRLDADGRLLVTSQRFRDQPRNLEDALEKVRALIARALRPPKPRRPTRATRASRERRLDAKKKAAARKRARGRVGADEG